MPRFIIDNFNTGAVPVVTPLEFQRDISSNEINIHKIKIIPSSPSGPYTFEIFKDFPNTKRQWATKSGVTGTYHDPTDRSGGEVEEGYLIPYECLNGDRKIRYRVTNLDTIARSFDVTVYYDDPATIPGRELVVGKDSTTNLAGLRADPAAQYIHLGGDNDTYLWIEQSSSDITPALLIFNKQRGTFASRSIVQVGDILGAISFEAWGGHASTSNFEGVTLRAVVSGTYTSGTNPPVDFEIYTCPLGGAPTGTIKRLAVTHEGALQMPELLADPSAPPANHGSIYFRDNGAGKTQLVVRFPTGAVQVIATEP